MNKLLLIIFAFILIFGCRDHNEEAANTDKMLKAYFEKHQIPMDRLKKTRDSSDIVFALGKARSKSLSIARSKAQMDAREKLLWRFKKSNNHAEGTLKNSTVLQYYVEKKGNEFVVKCLVAAMKEDQQ